MNKCCNKWMEKGVYYNGRFYDGSIETRFCPECGSKLPQEHMKIKMGLVNPKWKEPQEQEWCECKEPILAINPNTTDEFYCKNCLRTRKIPKPIKPPKKIELLDTTDQPRPYEEKPYLINVIIDKINEIIKRLEGE